MNRKQRMQNRATAASLAKLLIGEVVCSRCGKPGYHYIVDPIPQIGGDCSGWLCNYEQEA